jgi:hypothetical protein
MRYMLLIYSREAQWNEMSEQARGQVYGEYMAFTEAIKKSGHYKAGDPLQPTSSATTVRMKNGKAVATDGPFAETREQLGGFYIVDAKDLDEANEIAGRVPGAKYGSIEVRPIMDM